MFSFPCDIHISLFFYLKSPLCWLHLFPLKLSISSLLKKGLHIVLSSLSFSVHRLSNDVHMDSLCMSFTHHRIVMIALFVIQANSLTTPVTCLMITWSVNTWEIIPSDWHFEWCSNYVQFHQGCYL